MDVAEGYFSGKTLRVKKKNGLSQKACLIIREVFV